MVCLCSLNFFLQYPSLSLYTNLDVQAFREDTICHILEHAQDAPADVAVDFVPPAPRGSSGPIETNVTYAPYFGAEPWNEASASHWGF